MSGKIILVAVILAATLLLSVFNIGLHYGKLIVIRSNQCVTVA